MPRGHGLPLTPAQLRRQQGLQAEGAGRPGGHGGALAARVWSGPGGQARESASSLRPGRWPSDSRQGPEGRGAGQQTETDLRLGRPSLETILARGEGPAGKEEAAGRGRGGRRPTGRRGRKGAVSRKHRESRSAGPDLRSRDLPFSSRESSERGNKERARAELAERRLFAGSAA